MMASGSSAPKWGYTYQQIPLGIRQLICLDRVGVRQKTTIFSGNRYEITAPDGQPILFAKEDRAVFGVMFGGKERAFHINVSDTENQQVITLRRPRTFGGDKLAVKLGGVLASVVRQKSTFLTPVLIINTESDQPVLRIKGPAGTGGETDFDILTLDKQKIGVIKRKWRGVITELIPDDDEFDISFPRDLDVRYKAAILGSCILIDFLYYER